jgi:rsbT co-antagonist protein RsbR
MLSIVGTLDSNRVLKIIDNVLNALEKSEIEYVIVDIGSIYDINSEVARQLIKLNNAIHYMGATAFLTGITPAIAKSLTHLDLSLGDVKTFSTTQKALEFIIKNEDDI